MTNLFECNGCGIKLLVSPTIFRAILTGPNNDDLCVDCYKATKQFLKDRYNNAKKGINTGLSYSSYGTTSSSNLINSFANTVGVDFTAPPLTEESCQDHKRKTGWTEGSYLDKQAKNKPRKKKRVSKK